MKRLLFTLFIFLIYAGLVSCTSSKKKEQKDEKSSVSTAYSFQKIDVKELYGNQEKELLNKIDFSTIKETSSKFYQIDKFDGSEVYIKRSPYDIFNQIKDVEGLNVEDQKLFLSYSLELGKQEEISKILPYFKKETFLLTDLIEVCDKLSNFDKNDTAIELLEDRINLILSKSVMEAQQDELISNFFYLTGKIKSIKENILSPFEGKKYVTQALKVYPSKTTLIQTYINYLNEEKKYDEGIKYLQPYLSDAKLKSFAVSQLANLYTLKGDEASIIKLYEQNIKMPENLDLFNQYITYLKGKNTWVVKVAEYNKAFNDKKTLNNFYFYYHSLNFDGKTKEVENLLKDYKEYLFKTPEEEPLKVLTELFISKGLYNEGYEVVNMALVKFNSGTFFEQNLINALKVLRYKNYLTNNLKNVYFFDIPDVLSGLFSLTQNGYKYTYFTDILNYNNNESLRYSDINYLYDNYIDKIKNIDIKKEFIENYFGYLLTVREADKLKTIASALLKSTSDSELKIQLLEKLVYYSKSESEKNDILANYKQILDTKLNDKVKFNYVFKRLLSFMKSYYKPEQIVDILYGYLDVYSDKEEIYVELLTFLDYYKFYDKEVKIYKQAVSKFNTRSWIDRFSRFLVTNAMYSEAEKLNEIVLETKSAKEFVDYLTTHFASQYYDGFNSGYNQFFERIYVSALKKYPFNEIILNKLLSYYKAFFYDYYTQNKSIVTQKHNDLLKQYIFVYDYLRKEYYDAKINEKKIEDMIDSISQKATKKIPEIIFEAEIHSYMNNFEKGVEAYKILASYYITSQKIIFDGAKLLKSLSSSFYVENPDYLKTAEQYFKRLTYLDRLNTNYYISLAELYYALNDSDMAQKTLFRALEYQKSNTAMYESIANVFYDFYDYDNALKVLYNYRERTNKPNTFRPLVGRLYELKLMYPEAIKEFIADILENYENYDSQKRLKSVYFRNKNLQKTIVDSIVAKYDEIIKNETAFYNFISLFSLIDNKESAEKLYNYASTNSKELPILQSCFSYYLKKEKLDVAEKILLDIEKLFNTDESIDSLISFYQQNKNFDKASIYFEKLLQRHPLENDKYSFQYALDRYTAYLMQEKKYGKIVSINENIAKTISESDEYEYIYFNLKLADYYKLNSQTKEQEKLLLTLKDKYKTDNSVIQAMFEYYRETKQNDKLIAYLKELIKDTNKSNLDYYSKIYRIESYRLILISELKIAQKTSEIQDQYIEILNKNPLDFYMAYEVYNFSKANNLYDKMLKFYLDTTEKSNRDYRYMMLVANFYKFDEKYDKSIEYFLKAKKIEPQNNQISLDLATVYLLSKKYSEAYKIYEIFREKEKNEYMIISWEKNLFETALKLNDTEKILKHLEKIAGKSDNFDDATFYYNVEYAATTLYVNNKNDLAEKYFKKAINKAIIKTRNYLNSSIYFQYFQTMVEAGKITEFFDNMFELKNLIESSYTSQYDYYTKSSNISTLYYAISQYLPSSVQYLSDAKLDEINKYLEGKISADKTLNYAIVEYFRQTMQFKTYEKLYSSTTDGYYYTSWLKEFYESRFMFEELLSSNSYKLDDTYYYYNNLVYSALLENVWGNENTSNKKLADIFNYGCSRNQYYSSYPIDIYISNLFVQNNAQYESLVNNKCHYGNVLSNYLANNKKELALKLIDNQSGEKLWKLQQKISVYSTLKDYSKDGLAVFDELLKPEATITQQINALGESNQLDQANWDSYLTTYSNYIAQGKLGDADKYIVNIIERTPKSQQSYISIGLFYENLKEYQKALIYYNYAYSLKENDAIKVHLLRTYHYLNDSKKYEEIKDDLLKSDNINTYSQLLNLLQTIGKLDDMFINAYFDKLVSITKEYDYYRLKTYFDQIISYYSKSKKTDVLFDLFKSLDGEFAANLYNDLLYNPSIENSKKRELILAQIKKFQTSENLYDASYWVLVLIDFDLKLNNISNAKQVLNQNIQMLKTNRQYELPTYLIKVNYNEKNIEGIIDLIHKYLNPEPVAQQQNYNNNYNNYDENGEYQGDNGGYYDGGYDNYGYGTPDVIRTVLTMLENDKTSFKNELAASVYEKVKYTDKVNSEDLINLVNLLPTAKKEAELLNLIDKLNDIYYLGKLKSIILSSENVKLFEKLLEKEYQMFFKNFQIKRYYYNADNYLSYIMNLIVSGKVDKAVDSLKQRPFSMAELSLLSASTEYVSKTVAAKVLIVKDKLVSNNDSKFIVANALYSKGSYDESLKLLNELNEFKYKSVKSLYLSKIYSSKNSYDKSSLPVLKEGIYSNPQDLSLKLSLLKYYIKNNEMKKAFFIFGKLGFNNFMAFNNILTINMERPYYYADNYYGDDYYEDGHYGRGYYGTTDYTINLILKQDKAINEYDVVKTRINDYSENDKKVILEFLYKVYQSYKNEKLFGLHVLSAYKEIDKKYEAEYNTLKKEYEKSVGIQ